MMLEIDRSKSGASRVRHVTESVLVDAGADRHRGSLDAFPSLSAPAADLDVSIRDARDTDGAGLAQIVAAIMTEFPGCIFDLEADFPELKQPRSSFEKEGGRFWVAECCLPSTTTATPAIVGCFGFLPAEDPTGIELQRVYLRPELRGTGLALKMFKIVQAVARQRTASFIELWTDSRFRAAQRFYEKQGFVRQPDERLLNDRSHSTEYHYLLTLD